MLKLFLGSTYARSFDSINVLRLIFNVSYSLEAGLVNLSFVYRLSLNLIDRSNPLVIDLIFYVCICCISQVYLSCECF